MNNKIITIVILKRTKYKQIGVVAMLHKIDYFIIPDTFEVLYSNFARRDNILGIHFHVYNFICATYKPM